ncbi:MAG: DNA repair protein RecN [Thermodesulfobacteriota bacterium]
MLLELHLKNLVLIDDLRILLHPGLNVFTGETGAGKSIFLQAVSLLAGGRASAGLVRAGADEAVVEALFELGRQDELAPLLSEQGYESADTLLLRRLIGTSGRSRFYLNGQMATAKLAGEVAERLLAIASQHEHQLLLQPSAHRQLLDSYGGLESEVAGYALLHERWLAVRKEKERLEEMTREREQRLDILSFQVKEIEGAAPTPGEDEALRKEKERLRNSEGLRQAGSGAVATLDRLLVDFLLPVRRELEKMAAMDDGLCKSAATVADCGYLLEDVSLNLSRYLDRLPEDAAELDRVTARIDLLEKLKRKYGVSLDDVIAHGEAARRELDTLERLDVELCDIDRSLAAHLQQALAAAAALSEARRRIAGQLAAKMEAELRSLSMPHARFVVDFAGGDQDISPERLRRHGCDDLQFLFSANPGEELRPLARIASGGELSRMMLALKCLAAGRDQVETVLFDEIDAGISGVAAEAVAVKIGELAVHHQVLCITHLPQIAAGADRHLLVQKLVENGQTRTEISPLSEASRAGQLARMLDGESVSGRTMAYVEELLERAARRKNTGEVL